MPFENDEERIPFVYVNEHDPDGRQGLKPRSWNLVPDESSETGFRALTEDERGYSVWWFKAAMTQRDEDLAARKVSKSKIRYNAKQARKQGRDYSPEFEQETLMSGLMALITTMSLGWSGDEFVIPAFMKDHNGRAHPLRGRLAPCTREFIELRPRPELKALEDFLNEQYEPETEEDEESFRGSRADSAPSEEYETRSEAGVDALHPAQAY